MLTVYDVDSYRRTEEGGKLYKLLESLGEGSKVAYDNGKDVHVRTSKMPGSPNMGWVDKTGHWRTTRQLMASHGFDLIVWGE